MSLPNAMLDIKGVASLCQKYRIKELSLFGSVIRDDFDYDNSDIDILVEFDASIIVDQIDDIGIYRSLRP